MLFFQVVEFISYSFPSHSPFNNWHSIYKCAYEILERFLGSKRTFNTTGMACLGCVASSSYLAMMTLPGWWCTSSLAAPRSWSWSPHTVSTLLQEGKLHQDLPRLELMTALGSLNKAIIFRLRAFSSRSCFTCSTLNLTVLTSWVGWMLQILLT